MSEPVHVQRLKGKTVNVQFVNNKSMNGVVEACDGYCVKLSSPTLSGPLLIFYSGIICIQELEGMDIDMVEDIG